jgi:hypothetical protein
MACGRPKSPKISRVILLRMISNPALYKRTHMTKTLSLTKTKTKTKTTDFPSVYWDPNVLVYVELPRLFKADHWKDVNLPAVPDPDETEKELQKLLEKQNDLEERKRRLPDILQETGGAPSPKWQRILLYGNSSNTALLIQAMLLVGAVVVMHYKSKFGRPRPSQIEPELRPLIDVPGHPSYPSGHATQSHLVAQALTTVVRNMELGKEIFEIANEISVNREWAGVHFASDTEAGKQLAREIYPFVEEAYEDTFKKAALEWLYT